MLLLSSRGSSVVFSPRNGEPALKEFIKMFLTETNTHVHTLTVNCTRQNMKPACLALTTSYAIIDQYQPSMITSQPIYHWQSAKTVMEAYNPLPL